MLWNSGFITSAGTTRDSNSDTTSRPGQSEKGKSICWTNNNILLISHTLLLLCVPPTSNPTGCFLVQRDQSYYPGGELEIYEINPRKISFVSGVVTLGVIPPDMEHITPLIPG
eukprot:sb/3476945/